MSKSIVVLGTLDTKGDQLEYLKKRIEGRGHRVVVIDVGVLGEVPFEPNINREQVAEASGANLEGIIALDDPCLAMEKMERGAVKIVKGLYHEGRIDGIVAAGGSMATALALEVMKALPIGVPKLVVSTVAHSPAIGTEMISGSDLMMLPWVAGLWGLNSLSKRSLETAAGAISGAVEESGEGEVSQRETVGVTSLGGTVHRFMNRLKPALEERGYNVAVFHSTGMSTRIYEQAISDGVIRVSLDLSAGIDLVNLVVGGAGSAGATRLEAAGRAAIPQIVSPGALAFHWGGNTPLPDQYKDRPQIRHNAILLIIVPSEEECAAAGEMMAEKLNRARGPTAVVLPMKHIGRPSSVIPDYEKLFQAFQRSFMEKISSEIEVVLLDAGWNDPAYVHTVLSLFDAMMK